MYCKKNVTLSEQFQNTRKILETEAQLIPLTHITVTHTYMTALKKKIVYHKQYVRQLIVVTRH